MTPIVSLSLTDTATKFTPKMAGTPPRGRTSFLSHILSVVSLSKAAFLAANLDCGQVANRFGYDGIMFECLRFLSEDKTNNLLGK